MGPGLCYQGWRKLPSLWIVGKRLRKKHKWSCFGLYRKRCQRLQLGAGTSCLFTVNFVPPLPYVFCTNQIFWKIYSGFNEKENSVRYCEDYTFIRHYAILVNNKFSNMIIWLSLDDEMCTTLRRLRLIRSTYWRHVWTKTKFLTERLINALVQTKECVLNALRTRILKSCPDKIVLDTDCTSSAKSNSGRAFPMD